MDFTKTFDRVNYWKLFNKLLDDNIPHNVIALLLFCILTNKLTSDGIMYCLAVFVLETVRGKEESCHRIYSQDT